MVHSEPSLAPTTALVVIIVGTVVRAGIALGRLSLERSVIGVTLRTGSCCCCCWCAVRLPRRTTIGTVVVTGRGQPAPNAVGVKVGPAGGSTKGQLVIGDAGQTVKANGTVRVSILQGTAICSRRTVLWYGFSRHGRPNEFVREHSASHAAGTQFIKELVPT